jgi:hypothetical protein
MKINLFNIVFMSLVQVVALVVPLNAGMKIIDDFFMPELTIAVVPAAICVQPENSLVPGISMVLTFFPI